MNFIHDHFFAHFYAEIQNRFDHFKVKVEDDEIKLDEIIDRLENRDENILSRILLYRKSEVGATFEEYLRF